MAHTPTPGIQAPGIRVVIRTRALNTLSVHPEIDSFLDPVTLLVNCSKYLLSYGLQSQSILIFKVANKLYKIL